MIRQWLLIVLGGGAGSLLRFLCQKGIYQVHPSLFPWGTLSVNIIGSFLLGLLWAVSLRYSTFTEGWRLLLMTGFCGGFTTFSAFSVEAIQLLRQDKWVLFALYLFGSLGAGLIAAYLGYRLLK